MNTYTGSKGYTPFTAPEKIYFTSRGNGRLAERVASTKTSATYKVARSDGGWSYSEGTTLTLLFGGMDLKVQGDRDYVSVYVVDDPEAVFTARAFDKKVAEQSEAIRRAEAAARKAEVAARRVAALRPCYDAPVAAWKVGDAAYRAFTVPGRKGETTVVLAVAPCTSDYAKGKWAATATWQDSGADSSFSSVGSEVAETREEAVRLALGAIGGWLCD